MKYSLVLLILSLFGPDAYSQINCPPPVDRHCTEVREPFDVIVIEQGLLELVPGELIGDWDCEESSLQMEYFLHDLTTNQLSNQPECYQDINVESFDNADIAWPEGRIEVVGKPLDEVLSDPALLDGLSPALENACNIIYTYRDQILPGTVRQKVIRSYTALDWCKAETIEFVQIIIVDQVTVNGFYVDMTSCEGKPIVVEDFDILINGNVIAYQDNCGTLASSVTIADLLNCVVASSNINPTDVIELNFKSGRNPIAGISTVDMVKIQRHILGLEPLDSNCKLYAADANNDNVINGIDLVELRKLILGIYTELPQAGPVKYYLDGDITKPLSFKDEDFPLPAFSVGVVYKGDVD